MNIPFTPHPNRRWLGGLFQRQQDRHAAPRHRRVPSSKRTRPAGAGRRRATITGCQVILAIAQVLAVSERAVAQVYRHDNGQAIFGTSQVYLDGSLERRTTLPNANLPYTDISTLAAWNPGWSGWLDLSHANLRGINLQGGSPSLSVNARFNYADLTNAYIANTSIAEAELAFANIAGARFERTGLTESQLYSTSSYRNKNLRGVGFAGDDLSGWDFSGQDLTKAAFITSGAGGSPNLAGANFTDARIDGARFGHFGISAEQLYSTTSYKLKNLRGLHLNSNAKGWDFRGQDLTGASATFTNADLTGAIVTGADLRTVTDQQLYSTASYVARDLRGVRLGSNLVGWNLASQDLSNGTFDQSDLRKADFSNATITGADFHGSNLSPEQLYSTANYRTKNLSGVRLAGVNVAGWDFHDQSISGAHFGDKFTFDQLRSTASYQQQDISGVRLEGIDLSGWNLAGQRISGVEFVTSKLTRDQLESTQSYHAKDLTGVSFSGVDRFELDLRGWDFSNQNLTNARFDSNTNLQHADFHGAVIRGATFNTKLTAEQLYSTKSYQEKDLSGVRLGAAAGLDLAGQKLRGAHLGLSEGGVRLSGADLTNASLYPTGMNEVDLALADLRGAYAAGGICKCPNLTMNGAYLDNTIVPDGTVQSTAESGFLVPGLNLEAGDRLVVRNHHADAARDVSPIPVRVSAALKIGPDSGLVLEFDDTPWNSTIVVDPSAQVTLAGSLALTFQQVSLPSLPIGRPIRVFDWQGRAPSSRLRVVPMPGMVWDTSQLYTLGEITLLGISTDLNGDRDVDSDDLTGFLANWTGAAYAPGDKTWQDGDSDTDGDVDAADMLVFLSQWTGAAAEASRIASVPEPSGVRLIGIALAGLTAILRRRDGRR